MRKIVILFSIILASFLGFSQQDAQFTLYPWGQMYFNPGAIGEQNNTLCFSLLFREQYLGFQDVIPSEQPGGEPTVDQTRGEQVLFNIDTYLKKLHGGIGLSLIKDKNGYFENVGVRLGYAYKMNIGGGKLGIGLQVGLLNMKLANDVLRPGQIGDPIIEAMKQGETYMNLDFNLGVLYKTATWYVGASATQLATTIRLSGTDAAINLSRQIYAYGGYIYTFPANPSWQIEPQALIKTDLKSISFDIMALVRYNGILWFGSSYRLNDAVSIFAGARPFHNSSNIYLKGLDVGLAYGFTANSLGYMKNRSFGDLELMVRYCFDIFKPEVFSGYGSTRSIYKNQYNYNY